jgi:formylglycine-generating enzyme required for sulfatase activity
MFAEALGLGAELDMVLIPAGSFRMGSPAAEPERRTNEGPQHNVTLASLFMGASPVTQGQWAAVVSAHPDRIHLDLDPSPAFFKGTDLPVESISWSEAEELCLRPKSFACASSRLLEGHTGCRARPNGSMLVAPGPRPRSILGRRLPRI